MSWSSVVHLRHVASAFGHRFAAVPAVIRWCRVATTVTSRPANGVRPDLEPTIAYPQSGQQPEPHTFVAAAAVVANSATSAAASPNSFVFIVASFRHE